MGEPSRDAMHALYVHALGRITSLGPGGCAERVGPWLCIDAGLGVSDFNIAVVVEGVANPKAALREAMEWFAFRGLNARLDLRGTEDRAVLAAAMVEGFVFKAREAVMALHPLPPESTGHPRLEVRTVERAGDIELYCAVDREEYHDQEFQRAMVERSTAMEGVSLHLGLLEGNPVARSMGITVEGLVAVHNVYVPPSQRKQGFGTALTAAAIDAGRGRGATAACLEATPLGLPVYERMGFRRVDDYVVMTTEGVLFPK